MVSPCYGLPGPWGEYASNSSSSKMRWSLLSTETLKPARKRGPYRLRGRRPAWRRAAVVVGVSALRCSAGLVSARRCRCTATSQSRAVRRRIVRAAPFVGAEEAMARTARSAKCSGGGVTLGKSLRNFEISSDDSRPRTTASLADWPNKPPRIARARSTGRIGLGGQSSFRI